MGAALKGLISFCKGISEATYRSSGIIKLCVNSNKCLRMRAVCTCAGRLVLMPKLIFFSNDLSLFKNGLYLVYRPGDVLSELNKELLEEEVVLLLAPLEFDLKIPLALELLKEVTDEVGRELF